MQCFLGRVEIIGVNPYVEIPSDVLLELQRVADKKTSPLPVRGRLNGKGFIQTVVKFRGVWRLYLNTPMREVTNTKVGDTVTVEVEYDPETRTAPPIPPLFLAALKKNSVAYSSYLKLAPYRQKEICRYLGNLKQEETFKRNMEKVIAHLCGEKVSGVLFR